MSLQGKVALISGGARGIGFAIAQELLRHKIQALLLTDINVEGGEKAAKQLQNEFSSDQIIFMRADASIEDEYEEAFKKASSTFGKIDIVVNNAGIAKEDNYAKMININLLGALYGTSLGLKYMSLDNNHAGGVILNMASICSICSMGPPVYTASKSGVLGMSLVFGKKTYVEQTGVRVIALCPGITDTEFIKNYEPQNKYELLTLDEKFDCIMQKPETVAKAAVYAIINGESASAWVINNNNLYKANIPEMKDICELVQENL